MLIPRSVNLDKNELMQEPKRSQKCEKILVNLPVIVEVNIEANRMIISHTKLIFFQDLIVLFSDTLMRALKQEMVSQVAVL